MPDSRPTLAELARLVAAQGERINALERRLNGMPAPEMLALKPAAWAAGVPYQRAARWCRTGIVHSERRGGRFFVDQNELEAFARRMKLCETF
jgi:hypothetical protein